MISDFAEEDNLQNDIIQIDFKFLINEFKIRDGKQVSEYQYLGIAENFNFTLSGILKDSETGESLPFC